MALHISLLCCCGAAGTRLAQSGGVAFPNHKLHGVSRRVGEVSLSLGNRLRTFPYSV